MKKYLINGRVVAKLEPEEREELKKIKNLSNPSNRNINYKLDLILQALGIDLGEGEENGKTK